MSFRTQNEKGFSVVEGLLVVVIVAAIAAAGLVVLYQHHRKKPEIINSSTESSLPATTASPMSSAYDGWQTANLKYERAIVYYPTSWKISNVSIPGGASGCVNPGSDTVTLTAPDFSSLYIATGLACGGVPNGTVLASTRINALGGDYYLDVLKDEASPPYEDCLSTSSTLFKEVPSKYITVNSKTQTGAPAVTSICFAMPTADDDNTSLSGTAVLNSQYLSNAELIIESIKY